MTNRRRVGKRGAAIDGDVSGSTIITGDGNVVQISPPADHVATALHQLRAPVGDFVGREQEIDALINALRRNSRASITGISGMGGIGKTELALLVADRLSDDYPDAQFFINLQGTDANPRSPQEVMAICIRAFLGPEARLPGDLDQLSQLYRSQLSGKRVLLLLDNAADSAQVRPLLPPPGSALLVTSRQTIALPGMAPLTLNPLTDKKAQELLLEIAPHAVPAAEQICQLCGYLPLAIRAAGSLLAIMVDSDPADYATQLKDERKRLERIGAEGVDFDVKPSFNLSYARLTREASRVFCLLSVFPGTFDAAAAEVVCEDPGHVCLSDLVRRSLVLYDASTKRYRLHDLLRLFADGKLSAAERTVGLKHHAMHYKNVLSTADDLYRVGGEALSRGLALFDLEWGNIQAGHAWVASQDVSADEDVAWLGFAYANAAFVLGVRQRSRERIRWLEIALAASKRLKTRVGEGIALCNLGNAYGALGETKRAIQFYEQYLTFTREIGLGEEGALCNLGSAYVAIGESKRGIEFLEEALLIFREFGERREEGKVLNGLGNAYCRLGEIKRAIQFYEQHMVITHEFGDRRGEAIALGNLGNAYAALGEIERAIQFQNQKLTIVREIGDRRGEGHALWSMSLALNQLGKRLEAMHYAEQSFIILEQNEEPFAEKVRAKLNAWRKESGSDV